MASTTERKRSAISMRMPEREIALIDRAAALCGRSRTDFMREAAARSAEEVLMEGRIARMSAAGFAEFLAVLSENAKAVPEIVSVASRPAPWERDTARS
jgi:uncharacterized protein (DUF1778 family)